MEYKAKNEFRVLIVEPQKPPYAVEIDFNLDVLQALVGGSIQFAPLDRNTSLYCNSEGKLSGLPGNRRLDNGDIVVGTFIIFRDDGTGVEASLTDEQIEKYMRRFKEPEQFSYQQVKDISRSSVKTFRSPDEFIQALFDEEAENEAEDEMER